MNTYIQTKTTVRITFDGTFCELKCSQLRCKQKNPEYSDGNPFFCRLYGKYLKSENNRAVRCLKCLTEETP